MDTFWNFLAGLLKFLISFIIIGPLIAILLIGIGIGALFYAKGGDAVYALSLLFSLILHIL